MHRARRGRVAAALVALTVVLAACSAGSQGSGPTTTTRPPGPPVPLPSLVTSTGLWRGGVTGDAWSTPVELDGGQLVVGPPPPGVRPGLARPAALARFLSAVDVWRLSSGQDRAVAFGLGEVTLASGLTPGGLPRYRRRLAWVGVTDGARYSCPAPGTPPPAPPTPGWQALVMDASTGRDVLAYTSRGAGCAGGPTVTAGVLGTVSTPWTGAIAQDLVLRFAAGCGGTSPRVVWSAPPSVTGRAPVQVVVERPLDQAVPCRAVEAGSATLRLPAGVTATHGPLGPFADYTGPVNARSAASVAPQPVGDFAYLPARHLHDGRWTLPAELDGGLLTVVPPPAGTAPAVPYARALAEFTAQAGRVPGHPSPAFGLGLVTIAAGLTGSGLPRFERRLAWIGFVQIPTDQCPELPVGTTYQPPVAGPGSTPLWEALVFDAGTGGDAVTYTSRAGQCASPPTGPTVRATPGA